MRITDMPPEMVLHMCGYMDPQTFRNFRSTCRQFRHLVQDNLATILPAHMKTARLGGSEKFARLFLDEANHKNAHLSLKFNIPVSCMGFSSDSKYFALGVRNAVQIHTAEDGLCIKTLKIHADSITALTYLRLGNLTWVTDEGRLVISSAHHTPTKYRVYRAVDRALINVKSYESEVYGNFIVTATADGIYKVLAQRDEIWSHVYSEKSEGICEFSDGFLLTAGGRQVKIFNLHTQEVVYHFQGPEGGQCTSAQFQRAMRDPGGGVACLTFANPHRFYVWAVELGAITHKIDYETRCICKISPHLACVQIQSMLFVDDSEENYIFLPDPGILFQGVTLFQRDARFILIVQNGDLAIYDRARYLYSLRGGHTTAPAEVQISPDGTRVLSRAEKGARVWAL